MEIILLIIISALLLTIVLTLILIPLVRNIARLSVEMKYLDAHSEVVHDFGELWEHYNKKIQKEYGYDASIIFMDFISEAQTIIFSETDKVIEGEN